MRRRLANRLGRQATGGGDADTEGGRKVEDEELMIEIAFTRRSRRKMVVVVVLLLLLLLLVVVVVLVAVPGGAWFWKVLAVARSEHVHAYGSSGKIDAWCVSTF